MHAELFIGFKRVGRGVLTHQKQVPQNFAKFQAEPDSGESIVQAPRSEEADGDAGPLLSDTMLDCCH